MKIALIFSGQLRNSILFMKKNIDYFAKQDGVSQIDTYIHAWWDKDHIGDYCTQGSLVQEEDPSESIETILRPIRYKLEKQIDIDLSNIPEFRPGLDQVSNSLEHEISFFGPLSQMASFRKGFELIENPNTYDIIIRMRADLSPNDEDYLFPIQDFSDPGIIYTTHGRYIDGFCWGDWFYAGSPDAMKTLAENVEANFRNYIKQRGVRGDTYEHISACISMCGLSHANCNLFFRIERDQYPLKVKEGITKYSPYWLKNIKR